MSEYQDPEDPRIAAARRQLEDAVGKDAADEVMHRVQKVAQLNENTKLTPPMLEFIFWVFLCILPFLLFAIGKFIYDAQGFTSLGELFDFLGTCIRRGHCRT